MKKLVSLVLVAVMMMCAVPAFATETTVVNWADLQEQGAETIARGEFVVFDEIAVKMWVPAGLNAVELTDEDKESGYIAYFMPEDESAALAVMYVDANGMTLEEYKALLPDTGATEIEDVIVNGMPAITYVLEENDTVCISFATEAGYIFEVSGAPKSDEGFSAVLALWLPFRRRKPERRAKRSDEEGVGISLWICRLLPYFFTGKARCAAARLPRRPRPKGAPSLPPAPARAIRG